MAAVLIRDTVTRWFTQGGIEMRHQCRENGENETGLHHGDNCCSEIRLEQRTVRKGNFPRASEVVQREQWSGWYLEVQHEEARGRLNTLASFITKCPTTFRLEFSHSFELEKHEEITLAGFVTCCPDGQ